jgi:hypothetical protein
MEKSFLGAGDGGGWGHHPLLQMDFEGRVGVSPARENVFPLFALRICLNHKT